MSNTVTALTDRIEVIASLQLKQALSNIGNGRFLGSWNKFVFPKTPITAQKIYDVLADASAGYEENEDFIRILRKNRDIEDAQRWKTEEASEQPIIRKSDLWQHQLNAYHFGKELRSVMYWMGVGTGKSKLAIDVAQNNRHKKILLICPPYIHKDDETWTKQFANYFEGDYVLHRCLKGTVERKAADAKKFLRRMEHSNATAIVAINYESFWRPAFAEFVMSEKFGLLIADESHKLKSHNSQVAEFTAKASRNFEQTILLTGTVMYANPLDVFGQYRILDSAIFGTSFTRFRSRYADIYDHNGIPIIKGYINQDELVERIAPITYQVDESVLNLPEPIHDVRTFELSTEERKVYRQMEDEAALDLGKEKGYTIATHILTKLIRMRQITGGVVPLQDWETDETRITRIGDSKKQLFKSILDDLPKDEPIVVFARFIADLQMVEEAARELGRSYGEISGRRYDKNEWNKGSIQVLGVNDSAGEGMDFTRANYGCFFSYDYSIGKFKQCVGRIRRPPNTRFAYFYHLTAKNTIDEQMYAGIKEGENLLHKAIDYLRSLR